MNKIKGFEEFLEAISGTELVGKHMGPNYPEQDNSPMKKVGLVDVLYSEVFGVMVTYDEYLNIYNDYLKNGGSPLQGFNLENLNKVLSRFNENDENNLISFNESQIQDENIDDIFRELTNEGGYLILKKKLNTSGDKNYLILRKDVLKTEELFFQYSDVKDEICHLVSYLEDSYYNCLIEKRWDDGKYGINPNSYVGKEPLSSVTIIYKD